MENNAASINAVVKEMPDKNRLTAGLLGIFLGIFGGHNFYLGYIKKAIVQLCLTLSCPLICFLAFYLGLGVYHTYGTKGLGTFSIILFCLSILAVIFVCVWWLVDIIRIFTGKVKDLHGNLLQ